MTTRDLLGASRARAAGPGQELALGEVAAAVLTLGVPLLHPGSADASDAGPAATTLTYPVDGLGYCVPAGDLRVRVSAGPCQHPAASSGTR